MSTSFPVSLVAPRNPPQLSTRDLLHAVAVGPGRVEACGFNAEPVDLTGYQPEYGDAIPHVHGLILAVHTAYADHLPLTLAPDDIWLPIAQGFALHSKLHPETTRGHFASGPAQEVLSVEFPFTKGDPNAPWPQAIAELTSKIGEKIGPNKLRALGGDFSTTGVVERVCQRAALMDALSSFYQYRGYTLCGIPEITLLGTPEDWEALHQRAAGLEALGAPKGWMRALLPVTAAFMRAAQGEADLDFFRSFYKLDNESGGPNVSGSINGLFPYVRSYPTDEIDLPNHFRRSNHVGSYPSGMSRVPITWDYLGQRFARALYAGMTGVAFEDGAVRPTSGWLVVDETPGA
jgi:energy-converting hydrogenase Eha subunit A